MAHFLPTELHVELMRFLDMESLRKVVAISRLPYALFEDKVRKWNARNVWVYTTNKSVVEEARQRKIFEISQHGLDVCQRNANLLAKVLAKRPFKLGNTDPTSDTSTTATVRHLYFEIRVNKSTGPILFGLLGPSLESQTDPTKLNHFESEMLHHHGIRLSSRIWREHQCMLTSEICVWPPCERNRHPHYFFDLVPAAAAEIFADGDVLGCGVLQFSELPQEYQLFFTKNGQQFGVPVCWMSPKGYKDGEQLFPFVGLVNEGTSVTANFGDSDKFPFLYDIGQHNSPIDSLNMVD